MDGFSGTHLQQVQIHFNGIAVYRLSRSAGAIFTGSPLCRNFRPQLHV